MTYPTPTEPGFYWAKMIPVGIRFAPVEVYMWGGMLQAYGFGHTRMHPLDDFTWGPRITMPEDLAVEEAGR